MRLLGSVAVLASLMGCNQESRSLQDAQDRADIETSKSRLDYLENRVSTVESNVPFDTVLTPQDHGFSPIGTSIGTLTLALSDVAPYADGSRIRLMIGNPSSGTVLRFSMHLAYGPRLDQPTRRDRDYEASFPIEGGTRRHFEIDLAGVPPSQLGFVIVSNFDVKSFVLRQQ